MQRLSQIILALNRIISPVGSWLHTVGVSLLVAIMLLTVSDVTLRYLFNRPLVGAFELTEYMMVVFVAFAFVNCAVKKGHVSVDLIVGRMPQKAQMVIGTITILVSIVFLSLIAWQSFIHMKLQYQSHVSSSALLIPRFPFVAFVVLAFAFLVVVYFVNLLETIHGFFTCRK